MPAPGPGRRRSLPLGRILGVRVAADPSWVPILVLVAGLLGSNLKATHGDWSSAACLLLGLLASLCFFASILLHELGHVVVAGSLGLPVLSVTLHLFGGVSQHAVEPRRPRDAFLVAGAGPFVSLNLFLAALTGSLLFASDSVASEMASQLLMRLAVINFLVFAINVLPGLPLDGGFALRALAWAATGSAERGTRIASAAGAGIALLIAGTGITVLVAARNLGGLWLVLFGWLLLRAARNSGLQLLLKSVLERVRVRDVMLRRVEADRWNSVADLQGLVDELRGPVFVREDGGTLLGWLTKQQVEGIPSRKRAFVQVSSVLVPMAEIARIAAGRTLSEALDLMNARGSRELAVAEGSEIVGALTREGLLEVLRTRSEG